MVGLHEHVDLVLLVGSSNTAGDLSVKSELMERTNLAFLIRHYLLYTREV